MKLLFVLTSILFLISSCSLLPVTDAKIYESNELNVSSSITTEANFSQRIKILEALTKKFKYHDMTLVKNPKITKINSKNYTTHKGKNKPEFKSRFYVDIPAGETSISHLNATYYFEAKEDNEYIVMKAYYDSSTGISSFTSKSTTYRTSWKSRFFVYDVTEDEIVELRLN